MSKNKSYQQFYDKYTYDIKKDIQLYKGYLYLHTNELKDCVKKQNKLLEEIKILNEEYEVHLHTQINDGIDDELTREMNLEIKNDKIAKIKNQCAKIDNCIKNNKLKILNHKTKINESTKLLNDYKNGNKDDFIYQKIKEQKLKFEQDKQNHIKKKQKKRQEKLQQKENYNKRIQEFRKIRREERYKQKDILRSQDYFEKVYTTLPNFMSKKLKNMPCNKGYIWRGVWFFGLKKEESKDTLMFEKKGKDKLYIHHYRNNMYTLKEKNYTSNKTVVLKEINRHSERIYTKLYKKMNLK